jgi:hypothetical protein
VSVIDDSTPSYVPDAEHLAEGGRQIRLEPDDGAPVGGEVLHRRVTGVGHQAHESARPDDLGQLRVQCRVHDHGADLVDRPGRGDGLPGPGTAARREDEGDPGGGRGTA